MVDVQLCIGSIKVVWEVWEIVLVQLKDQEWEVRLAVSLAVQVVDDLVAVVQELEQVVVCSLHCQNPVG